MTRRKKTFSRYLIEQKTLPVDFSNKPKNINKKYFGREPKYQLKTINDIEL